MPGCPSEFEFVELLEDRLDEDAIDRLQTHLSDCQKCERRFEELMEGINSEWSSWRELAKEPEQVEVASLPQPLQDERLVEHFTACGYSDLEQIGHGGMGLVFRAHQPVLNRHVAIKMLVGGALAGPERLRRLTSEARAQAQLRHDNIVQIYGVERYQDIPYLVLEYVDGGSLAGMLKEGPLEPRQAALHCRAIASAVVHSHSHGIIHRDIKPSNILFSGHVARLADFGLAKVVQPDGELTGSALIGTPAYMAPEQASSGTQEITPSIDVYAIGVVLYESLCGVPPFRSPSPAETLRRVTEENPIGPRKIQPSVPIDLETICLKCLSKLPQDRYLSAEALRDDLDRFLDGKAILARAPSPAKKLLGWARRSPLQATLASVIAMLVVFTAVVWGRFTVQLKKERDQTIVQADFANENFQSAHLALKKYLDSFRTHTPVGSKSNLAFQRETIQNGLEFYQELIASSRGREGLLHFDRQALVETQLDYAALLLEYAKVLSVDDQPDEAYNAYEQCVELCSEIEALDGLQPELRRRAVRQRAAALMSSVNVAQIVVGFEEAIRNARESLRANEKIAAAGPDAEGHVNWYHVIGTLKLAQVQRDSGQSVAAIKTLKTAEQIAEHLPPVTDYLMTRAQVQIELSRLQRYSGDYRSSAKHCNAAVTQLEHLSHELELQHVFPRYEKWLAKAYVERARSARDQGIDALATGRYYLQALQVWKDLCERYPSVEEYREELERTLSESEAFTKGETWYAVFASSAEVPARDDSGDQDASRAVERMRAMLNRASKLRQTARLEFSEEEYCDAASLLDRLRSEGQLSSYSLDWFEHRLLVGRSQTLFELGEHRSASECLEELRESRRLLPELETMRRVCQLALGKLADWEWSDADAEFDQSAINAYEAFNGMLVCCLASRGSDETTAHKALVSRWLDSLPDQPASEQHRLVGSHALLFVLATHFAGESTDDEELGELRTRLVNRLAAYLDVADSKTLARLRANRWIQSRVDQGELALWLARKRD